MSAPPPMSMPVVTEWQIKSEGRDTKLSATYIEKIRVTLKEMPSILNTPPDVLNAMNQFDVYVAEKEREAMDRNR